MQVKLHSSQPSWKIMDRGTCNDQSTSSAMLPIDLKYRGGQDAADTTTWVVYSLARLEIKQPRHQAGDRLRGEMLAASFALAGELCQQVSEGDRSGSPRTQHVGAAERDLINQGDRRLKLI
jgi:hypothetical protein